MTANESSRPSSPPAAGLHRVVVVGGGFGGLHVAKSLKRAAVRVTLVDRRNFHLFQPLLYQVATGALSPANIAAPLRDILKRHRNVEVLLAEVVGYDVGRRRVLLRDGELDYDTLIVAAGARHSYFGRDEWEPWAPGLKTIEDAIEIRRRILLSFEMAERDSDPARRKAWLTFVIVGGGPTGVELAGALAEIANYTLEHDFRHIDPADAQILIVEAVDRVLSTFPPKLSARAARSLERLGVVLRLKTLVIDVQPDAVVLRTGETTETLAARTVMWAAGVQASPLGRKLAEAVAAVRRDRPGPVATNAELDRAGRITVAPDLTLPGHPEIFVIGDMARVLDASGRPLPGVAPVAIQQGRYVARLIRRRLRGQASPPFRYRNFGVLATIGRFAAVADFGRVQLGGFAAWVLWLFVHLMKLVSFQNRLLVFIQWGWSFATFKRAARLITGSGASAERCAVDDDPARPAGG
ncbi:MAG TPA: NAD(P)/FAD-dependent oxidoreductase [Planctomycetaceae bacterium]|nr:NAD(P)/FAD-dependent oxidoreductase [Planctomycetaceae bacterium]